jgi:hypothetical protein
LVIDVEAASPNIHKNISGTAKVAVVGYRATKVFAVPFNSGVYVAGKDVNVMKVFHKNNSRPQIWANALALSAI